MRLGSSLDTKIRGKRWGRQIARWGLLPVADWRAESRGRKARRNRGAVAKNRGGSHLFLKCAKIFVMQNRIYIKDLKEQVGKEAVIAGWVDVRRDQGKMVFFDIRDMSGRVQCVALPSRTEAIEVAKEIRPEWVLKITGLINKRPDKNVKEGVLNGDV